MAWPATKVLVNMADTRNAEMTIEITGYQWKWGYRYVDSGVHFISSLERNSDDTRQLGSGMDPKDVKNYLLDVDRPLVIPADTKVRFVITAGDVIHAWWVPKLGWKQDAIPGIINDQWTLVKEPGIYRGQCAELCGKDHGFMPIVVEVKPKAEFAQWLAAQQAPAAAPAEVATPDTAEPVAADHRCADPGLNTNILETVMAHDATAHHDDHDHKPQRLRESLALRHNHKDIGTLYLVFSLVMFFIGGAMAWSSAPSCSSPACNWSSPSSSTR
jgi:heme/copper-type cytochrome/quinol oxidase subunit 2